MNDEAKTDVDEFDLRPDPRILPMLGEISLPPWRCVAELIDNSIDGFLTGERNGEPVDAPCVYVNIPTRDAENAKVTVTDNGPGMTPEKLEKAVQAGWTGNDPIRFLGMFGMGFNIATARLGTVTTVWTTRKENAEWHGLKIDFAELQRQKSFRTPHLRRPKSDPNDHGTEVTIEKLKPEQRRAIAAPYGRGVIKRELGKAYSAMLRPDGVPTHFTLELNGSAVRGTQHCVWSEERVVHTQKYGDVAAVQAINNPMEDRPFCVSCWSWLPAGVEECAACGPDSEVIVRERRVYGWVGIQRYLSGDRYGIDLLRNGRKIELLNRDLFEWSGDGSEEKEYPIDDPRQRGRIVGEIHIDHCRVTYMKDRFDRTDPAWDDMVRIARGEGPLRPEKAKQLGYSANTSPLYKLFQMFRRSTPKSRIEGCWERLLVVPDNGRAEEMAEKFHEGDPEYQDDTKWWELVKEAERRLLEGETSGGPTVGTEADGFGAESDDGGVGAAEEAAAAIAEAEIIAKRKPIASLTTEYHHHPTRHHWEVNAYEVDPGDPDLSDPNRPWSLIQTTPHVFDFLVNWHHPIFRSATMTPLDGLLTELAWWLTDYTRDSERPVVFADVLADLRDAYGGSQKLDPVYLSNEAELTLAEIAKALPRNADVIEDFGELFNELPSSDKEEILRKMATRGVRKFQDVIAEGRFLEYASTRTLVNFFKEHPELFLDGRYWDDPYEEIDFEQATVTEEARSQTVNYYVSLLSDAAWLAEQDPGELGDARRDRLLRAALALVLLEPEINIEEQ